MSDTKIVVSEAPSLNFAKCVDGTLEVTDPDDASAAWYFSAKDTLDLAIWLIAEFSEVETTN